VLLDLEGQSLVARHGAPVGTPALRTWWELTIRGRERFVATRRR
jgi:hypothetical protein